MEKAKYFTKYLPVEGEIKEGDKFKYKLKAQKSELTTFVKEDINSDFNPNKVGGTKFKLFLCSRDIQVSDRIWSEDKGFFIADQMLVNINTNAASSFKYPPLKAIGEVSPYAVWVKEGDEFEEENFKLRVECPLCGALYNDGFCPEDVDCQILKKRPVVYFRCPSSPKHFH